MTTFDIARFRLSNQRISGSKFTTPAEMVSWFGAVQAQDYRGALWAVGLRLKQATEPTIEQALADRTIIRTWPMRGTLHFVAAQDARWMLELLTPRVIAASAGRYRQFELNEAVFTRSKKVFVKALQGGKLLSRTALMQLLDTAGISTTGTRGLHILGHLAQERLICFGARQGKQQTFALFDEWLPAAKSLKRDEALAELACRYFTSHGPATVHDFAWWSGLTVTEAGAGLEMAKSLLGAELIDGKTYWLAASTPPAKPTSPTSYLLPVYDEYTVAYKDRSAVLNKRYAERDDSGFGIFRPPIILNGQIVGTWKRELKKGSVVVMTNLFTSLKKAEKQALILAGEHYGSFLGLPALVSVS